MEHLFLSHFLHQSRFLCTCTHSKSGSTHGAAACKFLPSVASAGLQDSRSAYLGSQRCTHGGGIEGSILLEFPPNLMHLRLANLLAMFSLHMAGRIPQNGAIRELGGGSGPGFFIKYCRRSPASRIASVVHCWRKFSFARASAAFCAFSLSLRSFSNARAARRLQATSRRRAASTRASSLFSLSVPWSLCTAH